jgi:hypothetical protein
MNWLLLASALLGFGSALGHAYLGERFVLGPLLKTPGDNRVLKTRSSRSLLRWVWHLPSFAWAQIAAATLYLALSPSAFDATATTLLLYFGIGIYMTGAVLNAWAMRGPHVGNILLTLASLALWFGVNG